MSDYENNERLLDEAMNGDRAALEALLAGIEDMVFNLSLRMLGSVPDAEDAAQEILIKVMTRLSGFQRKSAFSTWVFAIAKNYLIDYRKGMFAQRPLSFEIYEQDTAHAQTDGLCDQTDGVDRRLLARELKLCCTNVMLQCFDPESRLIYILGTMFKLDSRVAAELFSLTPEAYRQRLSRLRARMADFLSQYCGLSRTGGCSCEKRIDYAIHTHRLNPRRLELSALKECAYGDLMDFTQAMERLDEQSQVFAGLPAYRSPGRALDFVRGLLSSGDLTAIMAK